MCIYTLCAPPIIYRNMHFLRVPGIIPHPSALFVIPRRVDLLSYYIRTCKLFKLCVWRALYTPHSLSPYSDIPCTPKSKVTRVLTTPHSPSLSTASPRFNLRPLASYYTISCVSVGLSLLWLLLLPLWFLLVIMLVFLVAVPCA